MAHLDTDTGKQQSSFWNIGDREKRLHILQGRNVAVKFIVEETAKAEALNLPLAQFLATLVEDANLVVSQLAMQGLQNILERFPVPPSLRYSHQSFKGTRGAAC